MTKRLTKLEIIEETADYYSKNPRSIKKGNCVYNGPKGSHCAVGRCLLSSVKKKGRELDGNDSDINSLTFKQSSITSLDDLLSQKYRGHEIGFWQCLQDFHDMNYNWNGMELTQHGKNFLNDLRLDYGK